MLVYYLESTTLAFGYAYRGSRSRVGDCAVRVKARDVSSSIGLGHVAKDLAVARELRRLRPDAEILWLAGHPASQVLRDAGEKVLPEAAAAGAGRARSPSDARATVS